MAIESGRRSFEKSFGRTVSKVAFLFLESPLNDTSNGFRAEWSGDLACILHKSSESRDSGAGDREEDAVVVMKEFLLVLIEIDLLAGARRHL